MAEGDGVVSMVLLVKGRDQKGGMPTAEAAFSMGTANPMPMKVRADVGFRMAVTMPTTSPSSVTRGPPELPGLAAASNWIRLLSWRLPSGEVNSRWRPENTPAAAAAHHAPDRGGDRFPSAGGGGGRGGRLQRAQHGGVNVFLGDPLGGGAL